MNIDMVSHIKGGGSYSLGNMHTNVQESSVSNGI